MKKRTLSLCLAACILAGGMLASCKKSPPASVETTDGQTTVGEVTQGTVTTAGEETTSEAETTPEPETYPEINLPTDPDGVVALIDSIPAGTLENEWDIDRAYAAWAALSTEDRDRVTNYEKLRGLLQDVADAHIVKDYHDSRIPHGELLLGAYFGPTPTDENMQTVVDANLDFLCGVSNDTATLDQYKKYGVGAFVSGGSFGVGDISGWGTWAEEGQYPLTNCKPLATMVGAVPQVMVKDHEAIWGIDFHDEPGAGQFWWFDPVLNRLNTEYASVQSFANLLPNYAGSNQLGMHGYRRHLLDYANRVGGDILSLDHYLYAVHDQNGLIRGMEDFADVARGTGKDVMAILQLNRVGTDRLTTLGEVKFQAYACMAYGAKYIIWGCYNGGWFNSQALDENQKPTEQYYKMQSCNADLKTLSPIFMRYTSMDQTMLNETFERAYLAARHPLDGMGIKTITGLTGDETTRNLLMGYYEKNQGEGEAFLFVNTNSFDYLGTNSETSTVTFRTVSPASVVTAYVKGVPTILTPVNGVYTVQIVDADAVFVTVSEPDSLNEEPVAPIGQITIGGADISEFSIVIPAEATEREHQAAEALVAIIEEATFKTLPVVTDAENPAHAIVLGKAAMTTTSMDTARNALKNDGYAIKTEGGNLYISGNGAAGAGTLFGVYAFCEEYLNIRFYADGYVTIPAAACITIENGISKTASPSFAFRDVTNFRAMEQAYPLFQKYNGYCVFGDESFAAVGYGGDGLLRLFGINDNYRDAVVCLSDENAYASVLERAKLVLSCDPDADYLACDIGLGGEWNVCSCDACTTAVAADGVMGYLMQFVNRLAADLQADYPDIMLVMNAAGENMAPPTTVRPVENVAVRVAVPTDACRFHGLGDETCEVNAAIREALEAWTKVCNHVILLDQVTERNVNQAVISGNLLALYDTVRYLKDLGIVGYQQMGYDVYAGEFETMNAYLLSRLLWNADMTREEYSAEIDGFLQAYYGASATYIRQYMDRMFATEGVTHEDYKNDISMILRSDDKLFASECFKLWESAIEGADTPVARKNVESSAVQMYKLAQAVRDRVYSTYFKDFLVKFGFTVA